MNLRVGIPGDILCLPLRTLVAQTENIDLDISSPAEIASKLRSRKLDAAFVSPIEYARESSEYAVIPGYALSSRSGVALYFRQGLRSLRTMAADPSRVAEIVLARIVLTEEFESAPSIVPVKDENLDEMLGKAEGALLAGDSLLRAEDEHPDYLDLAQLWSELVDLPFVHGLLCTRSEIMDDRMLPLADLGDRMHRESLSSIDSRGQHFLRRFSFRFGEDAQEGMLEFIRYAHYHGMLPDIPQLRFAQPPSADLPSN